MPDDAGKPVFYLDVNVILDAIYDRRPSSSQLIVRISSENWTAITSPFSILEMLEAQKADKWAAGLLEQGLTFFQVQRRLGERRTGRSRLNRQALDQVYRDLGARLQMISRHLTFPDPTSSLMNLAEDISASSNIESTDVFHLATAVEYGCDILVSGDSDFVRLARDYMIAVTPDGIDRALVWGGLISSWLNFSD